MSWSSEEEREIVTALRRIASSLLWISLGVFVIAGVLLARL